MTRKAGFASMMTEPLGDKVKFCDRSRGYCDSKSPQHGLEVYWARLLERVKRERNHLFKTGGSLESSISPVKSREKN
jgi:hypothetical protein